MDAAWIAPPAVLGAGAAAAAVLVRMIAKATDEAQAAQRRFRRLEDGLIPIRVESRRTRASVEHLRRQ